ncbi:hypothetical protein Tco_0273120, partial [Tanacetum coccineum]
MYNPPAGKPAVDPPEDPITTYNGKSLLCWKCSVQFVPFDESEQPIAGLSLIVGDIRAFGGQSINFATMADVAAFLLFTNQIEPNAENLEAEYPVKKGAVWRGMLIKLAAVYEFAAIA